MASKRTVRICVDYAELFKRCPSDQLKYLKIVKEKANSYAEKLLALPDGLPKIDWDYYKANVRQEYIPMVEDFEKKYTEFQVPYPENPHKEELEKLTREAEEEVCRYKELSDQRIEKFTYQYCELQNLIPFDQMTQEDFIDAFPDVALQCLKNPTFWPHTPEEQINYGQPSVPPAKLEDGEVRTMEIDLDPKAAKSNKRK